MRSVDLISSILIPSIIFERIFIYLIRFCNYYFTKIIIIQLFSDLTNLFYNLGIFTDAHQSSKSSTLIQTSITFIKKTDTIDFECI
jgi:hypothetical protein